MFEKITDVAWRTAYKDGEILCQLESDIETFDRIFLILEKQKLVDDVLRLLCDTEAAKEKKQEILVLSSQKGWTEEDTSVVYRQITEYESKQLCRLYSMYEFSDRFQIISGKTTLYGNLFQLVDTGLLSLRESVSALLYSPVFK